jgi:hypothetical protein
MNEPVVTLAGLVVPLGMVLLLLIYVAWATRRQRECNRLASENTVAIRENTAALKAVLEQLNRSGIS